MGPRVGALPAGDLDAARTALNKAREANCFVEQYITTKMLIPEGLPEMYSPGIEVEATLCIEHVGLGWARHKEAVFWLHDQCAADDVRPLPTKKSLKIMPVTGKDVQ